VQGVFLGAFSRLDVLSAVENLGAWLFAAVKRRVIDEWRASSRRPPSSGSDVLEEIAATAGLDPAQALADAEIRDALADAIEALPPEQAFVIREQALEGSTFRELSERTGVPVNTLASRKRYAIDTIARTLRFWIE
jgi:RNA polymerase sigma factor (sigma-70 family)